MKIGIVGARLAGSYAAWLLAEAGHEVLLLDPAPDAEKPCGGGVTAKALLRMPWLRALDLPHNTIHRLEISSPDGRGGEVALHDPIHIFARSTLDAHLRHRAEAAGACFFQERAVGFERAGAGWEIRTPSARHEVHFLIGADGASSAVRRRLSGALRAADLSLALGFYIPGLYHRDAAVAVFQEHRFRGYLWSFPRVDHTSVGILRLLPDTRAADLRRRVLEHIRRHYPGTEGEMRFYAARIPCLRLETLRSQRTSGPTWALLGDAAGFADAITAEGISFALRSAELLAEAVARGAPASYDAAWRRDFGGDLARAAGWRDRFYTGRLLFRAFTRRAVQVTTGSATAARLTDLTIAGRLDYEGLRRSLLRRLPRIAAEVLTRRLVPGQTTAAVPGSTR